MPGRPPIIASPKRGAGPSRTVATSPMRSGTPSRVVITALASDSGESPVAWACRTMRCVAVSR